MQLNDVIKESKKTWSHFDLNKAESSDLEMLYVSLALGGEVGELQNKIKKYFRRKYLTTGHSTGDEISMVGEELADVIYYVGRLAEVLKLDIDKEFSEKMAENVKRYNEKH